MLNSKKSPTSSGSRKAKKKPGRPQKNKIADIESLYRDIMGITDPDYQIPECPQQSDAEKMSTIRILLLHAKQHAEIDSLAKAAERIHRDAFESNLTAKREKAKEDALRKLIFYKGEEVLDTKTFLQRLLPRKRPGKRQELLNEVTYQLPRAFMRYFTQPEKGWPKRHLAAVLEEPPFNPGTKSLEDFYRRACETQVTFKTASYLAPSILSWNKLTSSPAFRGSLGARTKRTAKQKSVGSKTSA